MTEQSNDQSNDNDKVASLDEFKSLSLEDMEKELKKTPAEKTSSKSNDQDQQNSETSDETSSTEETAENGTQENEQTSEEDNSDAKSDEASDPDTSDNQKEVKKSDKKFDYEKAYKELQAEFTRRNQKQKEMEAKLAELTNKPEKSPEHKDEVKPSRLAQLKAKDPEAAELLEELINEQVEAKVKDRIKPVEEQVTLRRRQENAERFSKEIEAFKASELGGLESELLGIWNENPAHWQQVVWDSEDAFSQLKKELIFRHLDKVAELRAKKLKESQSSSTKTERLKNSQVATKTKVTQATRDVMSNEDFRKLSLSEMEKRLPKHR